MSTLEAIAAVICVGGIALAAIVTVCESRRPRG